MRKFKSILITGGAGFIGSHVTKYFVHQYPEAMIVNLDKLTYAGNLMNLKVIENQPNYKFVKGDICDSLLLQSIMEQYEFDLVIHLAAESHVDRSILNPIEFVQTNVIGTVTLLNACKKQWKENYANRLFYHISTDEVYGSLGAEGLFKETTNYDPNSPYSASKASSDHFVRAYNETYGMPVVISNCSNNYGPFQFPEKLIPLFIQNILNRKQLPVYGDGLYTRDWLWVEDHVSAIDAIILKGKIGETYNIGGINEWTNIDLIHLLCEKMDLKLNRKSGDSASLITYVKDRAGHDRRYAIDCSKIQNELDWQPKMNFEDGLEKTIDWYINNQAWNDIVNSGEYKNYYETQYSKR